MATDRWRLKGDYFENCNCEVLCPCVVAGAAAVPTEGHCDVGFAFHIDEGEFNGVALNGLNFCGDRLYAGDNERWQLVHGGVH